MTETLPDLSAVKVDRFNRAEKAARKKAEALTDDFAAAYLRVIERAGNEAAKAFTGQQKVTNLAASGWVPPPEGTLLPLAALAKYASSQLKSLHRRAVGIVMGQPLEQVGISFSITHQLSEALLLQAGRRTGVALGEAVTPTLTKIVTDSFAAGLSVRDTASAIRTEIPQAGVAQAQMLARTDLNSLANGGSVAAAQLAGVPYKQWLTAHDEKVRDTHREADGQIVPVDQPFLVGGETGMYPADPDLSDEEAANCRCTVIYLDASGLSSSALPTHGPLAAGPGAPVLVQVPRPEVHVETTQTLAPEVLPLLEGANAALAETLRIMEEQLRRMNEMLEEISREREREVTVFRDAQTGLIVRMRITDA